MKPLKAVDRSAELEARPVPVGIVWSLHRAHNDIYICPPAARFRPVLCMQLEPTRSDEGHIARVRTLSQASAGPLRIAEGLLAPVAVSSAAPQSTKQMVQTLAGAVRLIVAKMGKDLRSLIRFILVQ